ncbi:MAG: DHA2 family efflux MFS transporter permease subunit [Methylobacter sp.]|uniref:DHA2 family efflux MFS transporter permease subunit n=1 Tax=Methylobacter sp. TaxID=2051955 RepID=UPI00258401EB|nr:DHA2 family efflux MFS transporter permease subunit [Methylobacter sp.]MCL7420158.1 DHA2 family efflux MFS transporter permease subunit [Methylobacter sp.]
MAADVQNRTEETPLTLAQWIGFFSMSIGVFMAVLDIQIVASSLKEIQAGLSATQDEIAWVQTSYLIAEVIIIPLSGWLARVFSTRYLYAISAGGFTLASLLCAFAWNLPSMVIFRLIQGFLGGAMIPITFTVIFIMFPPRLQPAMTIVLGLIVTIAPTIGPILGGYLTETYSWQALFLINVVPGMLVCILVWLNVDIDRPEWHLLQKIDFIGIVLIAIFLGCMQFVLEEGVRHQWFEDNLVMALTIAAVVSGIAMLIWELKTPHPIIDLHAFRNVNFAVGCLYSFVLGIGLYTITYLVPIYLGSVKGLNSLQIGYYLMVVGLFQLLSAFIAGPLEKKMDLRWMLCLGFGLFALGCWMNAGLTAESGYWEFFWPQAIRGTALMLCFLPINTLALGLLPVEEVKNASGLYNLMRNLGGAIGLAVANTLIIYLTKSHYATLREAMTATNYQGQELLEGLSESMRQLNLAEPSSAALKQITALAWREAEVMTFNTLFEIIAVIFLGSLIIAPFLKKVDSEKVGTIQME